MKKHLIIAILALALVFTLNTDAFALSLVGWISPTFNADNKSGTATYFFSLSSDPGDAVSSINWFKMDFITSAFTSASLTTGPAGMSLSGVGTSVLQWGTPLGSSILSVGESFTFSVAFTLTNPTTSPLYNSSTMWGPTNPTAWQQNFNSFGGSVGTGFDGSGGSTSITPEPGTLLLLGGGLIAAGAVRTIRRKRKSRKV